MKSEAICENRLFQRLYRKGTVAVTPFFILYFRKNGKQGNRLGLTTSVKIGNAVRRSRSRRVLREAYRLTEDRICSGYDFVLVARTRTADEKSTTIRAALEEALSKEGLLQ